MSVQPSSNRPTKSAADAEDTQRPRAGAVVESLSAPPETDLPPEGIGITIEIPPPPPDLRRRYWVGLVESCPVDAVTAGAVCFQKHTGALAPIAPSRPDVEMATIPRVGGVVRLDDDARKRTLEHVAEIGIVARVKDGETLAFVGAAGALATPLAYYAWMAPVDAEFVPHAGSKPPRTLAIAPGPIPTKVVKPRGE